MMMERRAGERRWGDIEMMFDSTLCLGCIWAGVLMTSWIVCEHIERRLICVLRHIYYKFITHAIDTHNLVANLDAAHWTSAAIHGAYIRAMHASLDAFCNISRVHSPSQLTDATVNEAG